jgi:hypothetical protein
MMAASSSKQQNNLPMRLPYPMGNPVSIVWCMRHRLVCLPPMRQFLSLHRNLLSLWVIVKWWPSHPSRGVHRLHARHRLSPSD